MSYQMNRADVFDFAASFGKETRQKGDELDFKRCPYCNGGSHGDQYTFSINLVSGAFKCLRASCGKKGHFVELCRDFGYKLQYEEPKIYKQLPQREIETREPAVEYLKSRGISEEVTRRYKITVKKDNDKILVFPFYDEVGKLIAVKYRKTDFRPGVDRCKEWFEKDTKPILFGMSQCVGFGQLVITEGQIDSLSVAEAGIENAVSVPTGASGFTWLSHVWEWLVRFKEIVVFGDCEHGKITLLDSLQARLPKEIAVKAVRIVDYLGEKDANDILRKYGAEAVRTCVRNAEIPPLTNVKQLADVASVDINSLDKISTGVKELDKTIRGMAMGQLIVLTGKRGEGKSTFMSQLIAEALDQKRTVFVYSGELVDFHFKRWLDYQLAGSAHIDEIENCYGGIDYAIKDGVSEQINSWYRGRAYIYDNGAVDGDALLETIERVILQYNAQLICVDNLMTALCGVNDQNNLYLAQSNYAGRLKAIATKYGVVVILVAHPRKGSADGSPDDNDLVSGSSDITNKADIVIRYERSHDDGEDCDGLIFVTKNRLTGTLRTRKNEAVRVLYSPKTRRVTELGKTYEKVYGWEKSAAGFYDLSEDVPLPF